MHDQRRILSIDGGGIKGVLPASFLATLEQNSGKKIVDHFDLIAGTSTGGIIALGLGLGLPAEEILAFYEAEGPEIFAQSKPRRLIDKIMQAFDRGAHGARRFFLPKYNSSALRAALERVFGGRCLGESATRLVIPAFDRQREEVHVFKTAHHERLMVDWKQRAVDVALGTAAAPTYLPSHRLGNGISLLDGGVWANNPVGLAVVEALGVLDWRRENLYVLSIGCTESPITIPENAGITGLALKMAELFMRGQSLGSIGTAKLLLGGYQGDTRRLFRYQHVAPQGEFELDAVAQITALKGIGAGMARHALPEIISTFLGTGRPYFTPCHPQIYMPADS